MKLKHKKICFLGDSITHGETLADLSDRFATLLSRKYDFTEYNFGVSGTRIAKQRVTDMFAEWDADFIDRVDQMPDKADAIVVFGGTNDYGHGDAPLGAMTDRDPYTFYGGLHTLYTKLLNKYPNARIVVMTPLHRINEASPRGDGRKPQDVAPLRRYVEIIREVAEYYALPVLDLYALSGMQPEVEVINKTYFADGLHPNAKGHCRLAEIIGEFLERI